MASPIIECPVSGRQRISLNRASLRRRRSMKTSTATNTTAAPATAQSKPRAQKTRSTVLQECVKTYFASLNSISRSIVLESEELQQFFGPEWESMDCKKQEEILNQHFVPDQVAEHYSSDRRSKSPEFRETEPEIDVKASTMDRSSAGSIPLTSDDETCFSPKGKNVSDNLQRPAAVPRRKEKESKNLPASSITTSDEECVDGRLERMDPVRRSFRVSSRQLADSRTRSMSMRVSRSRQQQQQVNRNRSGSDARPNPTTPARDAPQKVLSPPVKTRPLTQQQQQQLPTNQPSLQIQSQRQPRVQPVSSSAQGRLDYGIPLSRTSSISSSVSAVSTPPPLPSRGHGNIHRQRHHSSQASISLARQNAPATTTRLAHFSRRSEGSPSLHHVSSTLSVSSAGHRVRFQDDDCSSSLSQGSDFSERRFVPINQQWSTSGGYSPRRSRASNQSRTLDARARTRSQSPGKMLGESSPRISRSRSQSPGNFLNSGSSSHMLSDTEYYADSDITSQRSITPESILEDESLPVVRPSDRNPVHRSYSTIKHRGGSSITTSTSSFANPKSLRRSVPKSAQHRATATTINEVGTKLSSLPLSSTQSLDVRMAMLDISSGSNRLPLMPTGSGNKPDIRHSKTESDIGYISAGADELDVVADDATSKANNRESGYMSCDSVVPAEQSSLTKSLPLQRTNLASYSFSQETGCSTLDSW